MSNLKIEEEQRQKLIDNDDKGDDLDNFRPDSSRVKKVLNWNPQTNKFELE